MPRPPHLALAVLRATLPRAERDELLADIHAEYDALVASAGASAANAWLWRQAIASAPGLLRLGWFRATTGFEPKANAFTPGVPHMQHWIADVRFAARRLRTRPAYTFLAVLTLALGIGGTAAIFGVAKPILLDPLPYANTDQVVSFWRPGWWNEQEYTYLRDKFPGFTAVAMHRPYDVLFRVGDEPTRILPSINSSYELFDVLGAKPMLGRTFKAGEDAPGQEPVAVLSYGLWRELGGTQDIVGKQYEFDGVRRTVIGVMPPGFWYPNPSIRLWTARQIQPNGRNGSYTFVGKVAPGVDPKNMKPQIDALLKILGERFTYSENGDKMKDAWIKPLRDVLVGDMKPAVYATFAAMALILMIACVNVAALMLGQVEGRAGELAVRTALGATHGRITQQLIVEALLLGTIAGVVGGGLAAVGFSTLATSLPIGAWGEAATFDWTVFAVALGVAILAVLAIALVPTTSLWRGGLRGAISGARMGGVQGRGGRLEGGLVIAEVALAMLVATGATLLLRSVSKLYDIRPGIETRGIGVVDVATNRNIDPLVGNAATDRIIAEVEQLPGVRAVAGSMRIPLRGSSNSFNVYADGSNIPQSERPFSFFRVVTPRYFETVGMKILAGRNFDESDRALSPADTVSEMSVVVNETFAKKVFPGVNPIGRVFRGGYGLPQRVIGVVPDVAEGSLTDRAEASAYYLFRQFFWGQPSSFLIRTTREQDAPAILEAARRAIQRVAPEFAVRGVTTMENVHDTAVGPARQLMSLLGLLAGLALLLGAIGIYGVIAHFAARRKRDWAIRVALGLTGRRVVQHIVRQGVLLSLVGVVIGAIGAALGTRLLGAFLHNVSAIDPIAFAGATLALLAIGALAAFVPAYRAGTVDPAIVLREQ
jgi:putative ABC transport system permease protein